MTEDARPIGPVRTPETDEVLRRVGRNLLFFQQIEHLFKQVVSISRFEGTLTSAQANLEARQAKIQKQTLGQVTGQFVEDVLATPSDSDEPRDLSDVYFPSGSRSRATRPL